MIPLSDIKYKMEVEAARIFTRDLDHIMKGRKKYFTRHLLGMAIQDSVSRITGDESADMMRKSDVENAISNFNSAMGTTINTYYDTV